MKVLETKSGQIFEIWESRKEALHDVADIIDENDCTMMIWGKVEIYNIDDINEKYSEENDDESKFWNVT